MRTELLQQRLSEQAFCRCSSSSPFPEACGLSCSESLFYHFRIEDQVPENHLLRLLDLHISFDFVREKLKGSYSNTGRPSIDPELLLRILLIGYLYGVTSERKLVEELHMHLAWRWFTRTPGCELATSSSSESMRSGSVP
jgi:transposase